MEDRLFRLDYGSAIMGIGFNKLLDGHMPDQHEISNKALEVAAWLWNNTLTDEEKVEVRERFPHVAPFQKS